MKNITIVMITLFSITACSGPVESTHDETNTDNAITDTIPKTDIMRDTTPKVTGIGGIFFRSKDPKATREWYSKNLGLSTNDYGSSFESRNLDKPEEINTLQWSPFDEDTKYFAPSEKEFMINYRVQNIEGLVKKLKAAGVTVLDSIETYDYGKFVHVMDLEGNKLELWEPVDEVLTEMDGETTK